MKEMIENLRGRRGQWLGGNYTDTLMIASLTDCVFAVMARIDAMKQPPKVAWVENIATVKDIERAAMIKALRWADRWPTGDVGVVDGCPCGLCSAITRLENGGEL